MFVRGTLPCSDLIWCHRCRPEPDLSLDQAQSSTPTYVTYYTYVLCTYGEEEYEYGEDKYLGSPPP